MHKSTRLRALLWSIAGIAVCAIAVGLAGTVTRAGMFSPSSTALSFSRATSTSESQVRSQYKVVHKTTPSAVRAIYMTQCAVGTPSFRKDLVGLIDTTELNAVVIDIKDYTGRLAFTPADHSLKESVSDACGARDMEAFVKELHDKNIYVIGRITVFQDPFYTKLHPELAVKRLSDKTANWKDHKGLSFIDVCAKPYWDYIVKISKASYDIGFDELNFDYIRFPSDGNMKDIWYPVSGNKTKSDVMRSFYKYLYDSLSPEGITISLPILEAVLNAGLSSVTPSPTAP
mgnify:CR=1 FL=1